MTREIVIQGILEIHVYRTSVVMEKIIVFLMTTLLFYLKKATEIINSVTTYRVILSIVKNHD